MAKKPALTAVAAAPVAAIIASILEELIAS